MSTAHATAATSAVADYCPHCDERTSLTDTGSCPWCSHTLVVLHDEGYRTTADAWAAQKERDRPARRPAPGPGPAKPSATPERSLEQRMDALNRANEVRTRRAELKRDLKAGRARIQDLLLEPTDCLETAKVFDLLLAVPKYGRVKVNKILVRCRISPSKTVGGLSERQRHELVSMLRGASS